MIKTIIEGMLLQIHTSRVKRGVETVFDFTRIVADFRMPLLVIVVILWAIVFTTQLSIYTAPVRRRGRIPHRRTQHRQHHLYTGQCDTVLQHHLVGTPAATLHRLLYGRHRRRRGGRRPCPPLKLVMTRLVLLGAGYLLAVAASGLPVDKITIVLGALGVGIGLGLQNIVNNNFVSGIILIFDRPLQSRRFHPGRG